MTREQVLERLRDREAELRQRGVLHAALFGSLARDEQRVDSDIDILVDLDPKTVVTMIDYAGLKEFIGDLFDGKVDVVSREGLKPLVRPRAIANSIRAF